MKLQNPIKAVGMALLGGVIALATAPAALADFDAPKPRVDCTKKKNKTKPECQPHRAEATDDEIYNAAYWLARNGKYAEALDVLKRAKDQNAPRILNETGFATRKLGDVDGALVYYRRALAIDPNYVFARAYMGEALLTRGDMAAARHELSEIAARCGTDCTAYVHLAEHIAEVERTAQGG
jgi:tetratricopeptide (TPR) repeat protein